MLPLRRWWRRYKAVWGFLYFVGASYLYVFGGDLIHNFVVPPVNIDLKEQGQSCCLVLVEIESYSRTGFDEVKIRILLAGKAKPLEGHAFLLDGAKLPLELKLTKNPRSIYVGNILTEKPSPPPINLIQGERVEITLSIDSRERIEDVRFLSKRHAPISYTFLAGRKKTVLSPPQSIERAAISFDGDRNNISLHVCRKRSIPPRRHRRNAERHRTPESMLPRE